ncbi:MAG: hypothetical protein AAFN30_19640 [Actinomycetota bacterium]
MVKVLVATEEAQGLRLHDMAAAVEGELVYVPLDGCLPPLDEEPDEAWESGPGSNCPRERAFIGMASNRVTTTAMVVERGDLTPDDLWTALTDSLERQSGPDPSASAEEFRAFRRLFRRTLATAAHFRSGSIIERDGTQIRRRAQTEPLAIPIDLIGGEG